MNPSIPFAQPSPSQPLMPAKQYIIKATPTNGPAVKSKPIIASPNTEALTNISLITKVDNQPTEMLIENPIIISVDSKTIKANM